MSRTTASQEFWDAEITRHTHASWMEHPAVREYINRSIGDGEMLWPFDWFQREFPDRQGLRGLSIGCGGGSLERDAVRRGICARIDAFDASIQSLLLARKEAESAGFGDSIRYYAGDFDRPALPARTYEIVFFHQSMHHVGKLEKVLSAVMRALRPEGLLYLDEYVGPSRTDWSSERLAPYHEVYRAIPRDDRVFDELPLPIQPDDPSEAIRSGEIVEQLLHGFRIVRTRPYGGNLLAVLYPAIQPGARTEDLVQRLISGERELLSRGAEPFHRLVVATPRTGASGSLARIRYFLEPKIRRLRFEIARRFNDDARF